MRVLSRILRGMETHGRPDGNLPTVACSFQQYSLSHFCITANTVVTGVDVIMLQHLMHIYSHCTATACTSLQFPGRSDS